MTNFERAIKRLPPLIDLPRPSGSTPRWVRDADMPPEVALSAARMDALIGALAVGFVLGMLVQGWAS